MKYFFLIYFIPRILSYRDITINSDDDCWSNENNDTITKDYAMQVKFSSTVAYGENSCSVHIINPWLRNIQNGFGVFLSRDMDCSSIVTIDCLPDSYLDNRAIPSPIQFTCHSSKNKIEIPCRSINLAFKRNIKRQETKKDTYVQIVALAKGPCNDNDIFFQCQNDYRHSCIDKNLQCNGRSECPSGDDELNCHNTHSSGISISAIILMILGFCILVCIVSTVCIFCCCRAACNGIARRFHLRKEKKIIKKGDITITGEDAGLMKGLTVPTTVVEMLPQQHTESGPLVIDSTKPIYPRLE